MANENDQQHHNHQHNQSSSSSTSSHHNASDLQADCEKGDATTMKTKTDTDSDVGERKEGHKEYADVYYNNNNEGEAHHMEEVERQPTSAKGKLNDLVADLCINSHRPAQSQQTGGIGAYGDYTNSRPVAKGEGFSHQSSLDNGVGDNSFSITSTAHNVSQPPTQNASSFSFKHFLSSSSAPTAPSTTVTSLDPPATNHSTSTTSSSASSSAISSRSLQTSTGARPKVPQSNSVTSTSISSLVGGGGGGLSASSSAGEGQSSNATKMKRSPRFSSFDSQASLAEYAGASNTADLPPGEASSGASRSSDYRLYGGDERDRFADWNISSNSTTVTTNSSDYDRGQYVPRSFSNYEMPRPQTSPRRRSNLGANRETRETRESRPTRLTLNSNSNAKMAAKLKLDLPLNQNNSSGASSSSSTGGGAATSRKKGISSRSSDFQASNNLPGAAAAAALPDFVQDHWMDSWYANEMHVNSPPTSPIAAFAVDIPGSSGDQAAGGIHRSMNNENNPLPGPVDMGGFQMGLQDQPSSSVGSKMLPDFLSDGPIIHSSQRLADIATGLPSTSVGSPDESNITTQLSRLRTDNEILQRELNDTRVALNEQTLRANSLERQLLEQQRQHKTEKEETSDTNKKHSTAVQSYVTKLKQQIQQLTSEVKILKQEKELMREEGAVGGCSVTNCDRSPYTSATATATATGATAGAVTSSNRCSTAESASAAGCKMTLSSAEMGKHAGGGCMGVSSSTPCRAAGSVGGGTIAGTARGIRPSKAQQISRDLRRAASNAEQNLRQLLAGVDNLRQMASNIEKSDTHLDYDVSPDLFSDFLDNCDDFDEYPGEPDL